MTVGKKRSANRGFYIDYTLEDRAKIGKYTAENGPARATRHLSVPEMINGEKRSGQVCQI